MHPGAVISNKKVVFDVMQYLTEEFRFISSLQPFNNSSFQIPGLSSQLDNPPRMLRISTNFKATSNQAFYVTKKGTNAGNLSDLPKDIK